MPRPSQRTRSRKPVYRRVPGGRTGVQFKGKVASRSKCSHCGRQLAGASNTSPLKARRLNRGRKRVWRPYGGELCHNCLKSALRQAARTI